MTWDEQLFAVLDDLEQEAAARFDADRSVDLLDRIRAEYQQVTFASRLMASVGEPVALEVGSLGRIAGRVERVARDWAHLLEDGTEWLVPIGAITGASGLSSRAVPEVAWSPLTRLTFGSMLRRLAQARLPCVVHRRFGASLTATLARVGADFAELETPRGALLVPFSAIEAVRSQQ